MSQLTKYIPAVVIALLAIPAARADDIDTVRDRQKVEAERVEKEFADERLAAYKLVRRDDPKLDDSTEKLRSLLTTIRADTSLDARRREVLLVTLKADLDRVRLIASERQRFTLRDTDAAARDVVRETRVSAESARTESTRRVGDDAKSIIDSRSKAVADSRLDRTRNGDRYTRVMRSVDESAVPETRDYRLPKNWAELSKKRSTAIQMTAKERAIMRALGTTIDVEFDKNTFQDVVDYLKRKLDIEILVDKRAMEEAAVTYETPVSLKAKTSARTVLKRILADLNLTYVVRDEAVQITSRERAKEMTTVRSYYIGDIVAVTNFNVPPALNQLAMIENVNQIISMVTKKVDEQSWKVNNPDAVGTIAFDPVSMSLVVKQTAEVHYLLGGGR